MTPHPGWHLGVNTLFLIPGRVGGSERYFIATLRALLPLHAGPCTLFTNSENDARLREAFAGNSAKLRFDCLGFRAENRFRRILREQFQLQRRVRRAGCDALWSPGYTACLLTRCPQAVTIFDLQYRRFPEDLTPAALLATRVLVGLAARRCQAILTTSDFSKREIVRGLGVPPGRVVVTYAAADDTFAAAPAPAAPAAPCLLCVANSYPHKNLPALVRAFDALAARIPHRLLLVGGPGRGEPELAAAIRAARHGERIERRAGLADAELSACYRGADLFVLPSRYEGFGLPVLEAMQAGVPVVTTRAGALAEVGGAAATYADPDTPGALEEAILQALSRSPAERAAAVAAGLRHAAAFNWRRTAAVTYETLRVLAARGGARQARETCRRLDAEACARGAEIRLRLFKTWRLVHNDGCCFRLPDRLENPMPAKDLKAAYRTIIDDPFPPDLEISFGKGAERQTLRYEKVVWAIGDEVRGLRYGENPDQPAAMYKLVNGNLALAGVASIQPGRYLASDPELLQFGKHPGKINLTDADNALNILRYLAATPCAVIVKHNNPCGVARADTLADAYFRANRADRLAAFGGCIALNRECDIETARQIAANYAEVVLAPEFAPGVMEIFAAKKNLRVMRIGNMARLERFATERFVDFKSLIDGGLIAQWSFHPSVRATADFLPAAAEHQGVTHTVARSPTARELDDLLFGWLVEAGVTSNSVLYVKDGVTVGIGTGEQDRVGVAEIARDKAYRKRADWLAFERFGQPYNELADQSRRVALDEEVAACHGGLEGSCMVSDAFFPFRDGVEVGIREGVTAIVQPGGSLRDWDVIDCCNAAGVAMVFTGQRSFKH